VAAASATAHRRVSAPPAARSYDEPAHRQRRASEPAATRLSPARQHVIQNGCRANPVTNP